MYSWGYNRFGACGFEAQTAGAIIKTPRELRDGDDDGLWAEPVALACGAFDTVVVSRGGRRVARCGRAANAPALNVVVWARFAGHRACRVACGFGHVAVLLVDQRCLAWGDNAYGQCGAPRTRFPNVDAAHAFDAEEAAGVDVACGSGFTIVATQHRGLVSFGQDDQRQLGRAWRADDARENASVVGAVALPSISVQGLACGDHHTVVLDDGGRVYSFGAGDFGRLGRSAKDGGGRFKWRVWLPSATAVSAGGASSAAVADDGTLYVWGCNGSGQLGLGHTEDAEAPMRVELKALVSPQQRGSPPRDDGIHDGVPPVFGAVVSVALGEDHTVALDSTGQVWCWGRTAAGRLGFFNGGKDAVDVVASPVRIFKDARLTHVVAAGARSFAFASAAAAKVRATRSGARRARVRDDLADAADHAHDAALRALEAAAAAAAASRGDAIKRANACARHLEESAERASNEATAELLEAELLASDAELCGTRPGGCLDVGRPKGAASLVDPSAAVPPRSAFSCASAPSPPRPRSATPRTRAPHRLRPRSVDLSAPASIAAASTPRAGASTAGGGPVDSGHSYFDEIWLRAALEAARRATDSALAASDALAGPQTRAFDGE
ncbi:regulator of chromosome condensation 1/beta-lactamase-inhibitor protein II [Pelagophyceae sp. CCMP2097]|nr:regulator of chromosome condensation 1/beta-lactamase-inhibitor protein II [Pelagophyceae sp. CCMP2097]